MQPAINVRETLTRTVARMGGFPAEQIDLSKGPADYGVDSLSLLVLRETCERQFGVYISDSVWSKLRKLEDLCQWLEQELVSLRSENDPNGLIADGPPATRNAPLSLRRGYWEPDDLCDELEIGMPFTGINNLSENALLKYLGDLRWVHLSNLIGVPSKQICDVENNRLYATFFYVEVAFPESRPMASYMENDRILTVSRLKRFGESMLDGTTFLLRPDPSSAIQSPLDTVEDAISAGCPAIRLSNIFVQQFSGAEWLKKSRPSNPGFTNIRELPVAPESYVAVKTAEKSGSFCLPESSYIEVARGETDYKLIPERDVNGVGLVYFANYPVFLDMAERDSLVRAPRSIDDELCNRRTILRRRSAYLNNASWKDTLHIETRVWVQNPFITQSTSPELAPVRLFSNQKMYRKSDGRLMMISTAEKLIFGKAMEDLAFFGELAEIRA